MRTSIINIVANVNVFGFGQGRVVVVSSFGDTCAYAQRSKRPWLATAAAALMAKLMPGLAMVGPQRLPVRLLSPVPVLA
jgi:hypothetical protein